MLGGMNHPILAFFTYEHLPPHLREVSQPVAELANTMADKLANTRHPAELAAGLRKLLEAKDCLVRAALAHDDHGNRPS
jgi:hypothetical protein